MTLILEQMSINQSVHFFGTTHLEGRLNGSELVYEAHTEGSPTLRWTISYLNSALFGLDYLLEFYLLTLSSVQSAVITVMKIQSL